MRTLIFFTVLAAVFLGLCAHTYAEEVAADGQEQIPVTIEQVELETGAVGDNNGEEQTRVARQFYGGFYGPRPYYGGFYGPRPYGGFYGPRPYGGFYGRPYYGGYYRPPFYG